MQNYIKKILVLLALAVFAILPMAPPAHANDCKAGSKTDPGVMTADIALARPVGAVATVAGFAVFVVSSPFSALGGNTHEAWNSLVASPASYTFKRPLGAFDCDPTEATPNNPTTGKYYISTGN